MRPEYETQADRDNESRVRDFLVGKWRCVLQKTAGKYVVDCVAKRGERIVAWCEIKWRLKSYNSYRISLHKWMNGQLLAERTGLPFFIVVAWPVNGVTQILRHRVLPGSTPKQVIFAGRKDRNDPQDSEPHVVIPLDEFKRVGVLEEA